jgi:hypothetical protein
LKSYQSTISAITKVGFFVAVLIFGYFYWQGYDTSIFWNVTTSAESSSFFTMPFKKGPFEFSFPAQKYLLVETFSAGPIMRNFTLDAVLISFLLIGISLLLSAATALSRTWFIANMGLIIIFISSMHLPEVGLFGFGPHSSMGVVILLSVLVLPAYALHAFLPNINLLWRWLIFIALFAGVSLFSGVDLILLQDQFITGSYYGLIALTLIFIFIIAEENIFGILYLITQSKGGRNNHLHFTAFCFSYLGILIVYYGKKAGFWDLDIPFFNPYLLLLISSIVAFWSIRFKQTLLGTTSDLNLVKVIFTAITIISLSFLSLAFARGNDSIYEGFHYFIVYTHVAFGIMLFLYILWNFANPLAEGLQVYKIAYRSQNLPYVSAKLAGLAIVAGLFFLSNQEAFLLFQAGQFNYRGAQALVENQEGLAMEYFREGSIYGYDNHYSNYQLGYNALQKGKIKEANYRFQRASLRYPSAQTFVNQASTNAILGESTPVIVGLKNGLLKFPDNSQILNNLGLTYADLGNKELAANYLAQAKPSSQWTNAALVNFWNVTNEVASAPEDYEKGNLAVKANIIGKLVEKNVPQASIIFDTAILYPSYKMHRIAFLVNAASYFKDPTVAKNLSDNLSGQLDESMYYAGKNAIILNEIKSENINDALKQLDYLAAESTAKEQGKYFNEMGLIALSQHAPKIALDFFNKAIDYGYSDAFICKTASLLELGSYIEVTSWTDYLLSVDSSFVQLRNDLSVLDRQETQSDDELLFRLYYKYDEYNSAELHSALSKADENYALSLWEKISKEQLVLGDYESVSNYRDVFKSYLKAEAFEEAEVLVALGKNQPVSGKHPLVNILNLTNDKEKAKGLAVLASKNSLNEPLVLAISKILETLDPSFNYEVLIEAININRTSVALHKSYIMAALEIGLDQYAQDVFPMLEGLTTPSDFQKFSMQYAERKAQLDESAIW